MNDVFSDFAIWLGTFTAVVGIILVTMRLVMMRQNRRQDRLDRLNEQLGIADAAATGTEALHQRAPWLSETVPLTKEQEEEYAALVRGTGDYRPTALRSFLALRAACAFIPLAIGACWTAFDEQNSLTGLIWGGVAGTLGLIIPPFFMNIRSNNRRRKLQRALPDALDLLVMCLEAGLPLSGALKRAAQQLQFAHPAFAQELQLVHRQAELGRLEMAFVEFARRVQMESIHSLAAVIANCQRLGTDPVPALRGFTRSLRIEARQRADGQANKAATKLLFPMIFCLAPAFYIILLGPAIIEIKSYFDKKSVRNSLMNPSIKYVIDPLGSMSAPEE
jgi:tight adherence protein C